MRRLALDAVALREQSRRMNLPRAPTALVASIAMGCGGNVAVDEAPGSGGGGGAAASSSTSAAPTSSASSTASTGAGQFCSSAADCPDGVCVFSTGQCAPNCEPFACDSCGAGAFCNACASSSCPECDDCLPACVAPTSG